MQETLAIAFALVILVIFLFLRSASATIIPALAVPISLIGTCAAMYAFGFSINNMTLLALTLSVGFVVDDAIVMLENIVRHIEGGMRPFEAALKGAREIGFTIVSITFSLIAVFIPVLLMGGIVGRVFREFAVTIAVAIIMSGFVSLTLTPMLCARVLRGHHEGDEKKQQMSILRVVRGDLRRLAQAYEWALDRVLAYKSIMLVVTFATIVGTVWLYIVIPKGFFPQEDTGFMLAITEAQSDISFAAMVERQRKVAEIIRKDPAVLYVNSTVGVGGPNPTAQPRPHVHRAQAEGASAARSSEIITAPAARRPARHRHERVLPDDPEHQRRRPHLQERVPVHAAIERHRDALQDSRRSCARRSPRLTGLLDVTTDLYITNPQMTVEVDREKAAVYGITIDQVRQELFNAFGTRQVATIYTPSNDYQVILETKPEFRTDPSSL